jgi:hypothetical protein
MIRILPLLLLFFIISNSCKVSYSLTGASIPVDLKTVEIPYFQNHALNVQAMLSRNLTEKLKDKIQSQTSLKLVNDGGDAIFEAEITGYAVSSAAITGENVAAKNRLTITVHVKYSYKKDSKLDYDTSFSRYEDFNSTLSLQSVENDLIEKIGDQLVEDIFNKAFVNW